MDIQTLQCFLSVARHLNFTKAAGECHISQTAMSKKINSLENELGVALFYRDNRSVELTPAGTEFLAHTSNLIESYNSAVLHTQEVAAGFKSSLKIGIGLYEHLLLFQPMNLFHKNFPDVDIICSQFFYKPLAEHLADHLIDVMISSDQYLYMIPGVKSHIINDSDWTFVCHPDNPLAEKNDVPISRLSQYPFITMEDGTHEQLRRSVIPFGFDPVRFYKVNSYNTTLLALRANLGIAALPSYVTPFSKSAGSLSVFQAYPRYKPYNFVIAYLESNKNPAVKNLVDTILSYFSSPSFS